MEKSLNENILGLILFLIFYVRIVIIQEGWIKKWEMKKKVYVNELIVEVLLKYYSYKYFK